MANPSQRSVVSPSEPVTPSSTTKLGWSNMILDANLQFTAAAGDTILAATTTSTNVIDLHMAGVPVLSANQGARDIGIGDDPALKLLVQVSQTATGGTSLIVALQGAPDNGSGVPGTFVTWWTSPTYALAALVAGARLYDMDMPRPPAGVSIPRFLRLAYTAAGVFTAGLMQAFIVLDRMDQPYSGTTNATLGGYPAGITVAN